MQTRCETYLKITAERARRWPLVNFSYGALPRISKIWTCGTVRERIIELRAMMTHFLDPNAITDLGTLLQYIRHGPQNEQDIGLLGPG